MDGWIDGWKGTNLKEKREYAAYAKNAADCNGCSCGPWDEGGSSGGWWRGYWRDGGVGVKGGPVRERSVWINSKGCFFFFFLEAN